MIDTNIKVNQQRLYKEMIFEENVVLVYDIRYPKFSCDVYTEFIIEVNKFYKEEAEKYVAFVESNMYKAAVNQFVDAKKNDFPVVVYEVYYNYVLTYFDNCSLISLYYDRYEFTGGAHGQTIRTAQTWDILRGRQLGLQNIYQFNKNYRAYIITEIISGISSLPASQREMFFEDYKERIIKSFNSQNFYLTPNNLVIYFGQYEIAPYSQGILEYKIPYTRGAVL